MNPLSLPISTAMLELSLAYLFAAAIIAVLVVLAKRNQQQGWRKQRGQWMNVELTAAPALETWQDPSHMGDLTRLHQSLTVDGQPTRPEPAKPVKDSVLA
jgi:hypothetical protein